MKGVQCYELFGGIALKNHTFSFSLSLSMFTVAQALTSLLLIVIIYVGCMMILEL